MLTLCKNKNNILIHTHTQTQRTFSVFILIELRVGNLL